MKKITAQFFRTMRVLLFGARNISVGHCVTESGNSVSITLGRTTAGLTPAGARLVASQLNDWAEHAESMGTVIETMRYIINVRVAPKLATSWMAASMKKTADNLTEDTEASSMPAHREPVTTCSDVGKHHEHP